MKPKAKSEVISVFRALVEDMEDILNFERGTFLDDVETVIRSAEEDFHRTFFVELPNMSTHLEWALEWKFYPFNKGSNFHLRTGRPSIFRKAYLLIFSRYWNVREDASVDAILCLRQVFKAFKKYKVPCPDSSVQQAIAEFEEIEASAIEPLLSWGSKDLHPFLIFRTLQGSATIKRWGARREANLISERVWFLDPARYEPMMLRFYRRFHGHSGLQIGLSKPLSSMSDTCIQNTDQGPFQNIS